MKNNLNIKKHTTQRKIISTFLTFYSEKPFEKISIKGITEFCKINRGTFYLHYFDLNDLLTSIEDEHLHNICSINNKNRSFYQSNIVNEFVKFFILVFSYLDANSSVIKILMNTHSRPRFKESFKDIMRNNIKHRYKSILVSAKESELQKKEYIIESIVTGHMEIITRWVSTYNNISVQEVADLISAILLNSPYMALIKS